MIQNDAMHRESKRRDSRLQLHLICINEIKFRSYVNLLIFPFLRAHYYEYAVTINN